MVKKINSMMKKNNLVMLFFILIISNAVFSENVLVEKGSEWQYLDNGTDQGSAWRESGFDDSSWKTGEAILGYGNGNEKTVVSYGSDSHNKYITTYFRQQFSVDDLSKIKSLKIRLLRDDGAIVYLNGGEAVRSNMPAGSVSYKTHANAGIDQDNYFEYSFDSNNLLTGENIIAAEVHQISGSSSDISFDVEMIALEEELSKFRKEPYLIYTGKNTEYEILWQLKSDNDCKIEWGEDASCSDSSAIISEYGNDHQYKYIFKNLKPQVKYFYKVTLESEEYEGAFYSAPPENSDSVKFLVYGDTRSRPDTHNKIAARIIKLYESDPQYQSIIVNVGDIVKKGDQEFDWDDQLFDPQYKSIRSMLRALGYQANRGNHEESGKLLKKYFPYPYKAKFYWSFDYGPAHFAVIDQYTSYSVGSAQYKWLKNDLESTAKKWKFIVLHEPGWSAGGHENNTTVQKVIQPLCEKNNVPIIFGGHNHYYARAVVNGVMHITAGGGGISLDDLDSGYPNLVVTAKKNHFCKISIMGDSLIYKAVDINGVIIDEFGLSLETTSVESIANDCIERFKLIGNYPNPFNPSTRIAYALPKAAHVKINIYDLRGRMVEALLDERQNAGYREVIFRADNLSSGLYFYRLQAGDYSEIRRMLLIK